MRKLVFFVFIMMMASGASAGITGLGIGLHGGVVSGYKNPSLQDSVIQYYPGFDLTKNMYDIGAQLNINTFRVIEFDLNIDYAWKKQNITSGIDLTFSDVSVTASVRKSISLGVLKPYAGAGIGTHILAYSLKISGVTSPIVLPDNETKTGYTLKAGVELDFPLFPFTPYGEWRYNTIQTSGKSSKYSMLLVGLTLNLP